MTRIYWLTGAIGAGKTTLGASLAASMPETLFIDGDFVLVNQSDLEFEERIRRKEEALFAKCFECAKQKQSVVISYPVSAVNAAHFRDLLQPLGVELVLIGIQLPPEKTGTRAYSEWELKRQQEITELDGAGYADIIFRHPTAYLYDSVEELKKLISSHR